MVTPGLSRHALSSSSAGGQDEQPWLVKSSSRMGVAASSAAGRGLDADRPEQTGRGREESADPKRDDCSWPHGASMPEPRLNFRQKSLAKGHNSVTSSRLFRERSEHVVQDSAVPEIVELIERVDPDLERTFRVSPPGW